MAITRLRSKQKPKSPKNSPKQSPKAKTPVSTPESTPSKKKSKKNSPVKPSPLKKEIIAETKQEEKKEEDDDEEKVKENKEEEFELPSDSDSSDDDDDDDVLEEITEAREAKKEFNSKKEQINNDIKSIITHKVKTQLNLVQDKQAGNNKKNNKKKTGIIYIGRLPKGFEEYELKKYFEQFGTILNLRLSRNKKTGNSKHYAFVEFANYDVAKIALETMNNYLLFGHIIKVSLLLKEKQELFKNANTKFKTIPWLKISQLQNDKARKIGKWEILQKKNEARKVKKLAQLKEMGIDYTL